MTEIWPLAVLLIGLAFYGVFALVMIIKERND